MEAQPVKNHRVAIFEDVHCENHLPTVDGQKSPLPETPERVQVISKALKGSPFSNKLRFISPKPATNEELLLIHKDIHIRTVENAVAKARDSECMQFVDHDSDVIVTEGSDIAARYAAGAVRDAVRLVLSSTSEKEESEKLERRAFCNVRPPGHHSKCHGASGFCLYNNVWFGAQIARKYFIEVLGKDNPRIAIVDWDVHMGDGTYDFVTDNKDNHNYYTYFVSIHQQWDSQFPKTGKECWKHSRNSVVICHNIPEGSGDKEVKAFFNNNKLTDSLMEWKPDLILISCGFDGHTLDPIGNLNYSSGLFGWMAEQLVKVADKCCDGRIVSVLEGGYSMQALRESSVEHVKALVNPEQ